MNKAPLVSGDQVGMSLLLTKFINTRRVYAAKPDVESSKFKDLLVAASPEQWTEWLQDLKLRESKIRRITTSCLPRRQYRQFRQHVGSEKSGGEPKMANVLGEARLLSYTVAAIRSSK